jgi:RND family efflux transporter MFP subunit
MGQDPAYFNRASYKESELLFWRQFAEAKTPKAFCQSWLPLQCRMLNGVKNAMVLLGKPDQGPYTPVAVWPDAKLGMNHLAGVAEKSLRERKGLLDEGDTADGPFQIAYPIEVAEKIHGVVVLEVEPQLRQQAQGLMRQLHWGAAWLEVFIRRTESAESAERSNSLQNIMDLLVSVVEHDRFHPAAMAFVTRLAVLFDCERVSLGFTKGSHVKVSVLSHSADFAEQMNLARAIGHAMDEAVDQQAIVNFPIKKKETPLFVRAHEALKNQFGAGSILTIPIEDSDRCIGALTLERSADNPFDKNALAVCETAASLMGPVLALKKNEDRWIIKKVGESVAVQLKRLLGPGYLIRKLAVICLAGLVLFFTFFKTDYRVTAVSSIEGQVKRVIAAPFDGYVKEASVRAGDVVNQGEVICLLDDRDLTLERFKWFTEKQQLTKQYHEAMAKHERSQIQITRAKIDQADAQLDLLDEQLSRTRLTAPFNAVVMSGDLSQSLGAPVEKGQVLFEVAPLDQYRVIIDVDERDIAGIQVGQTSEMIFSSIPGAKFPFGVEKITPVTTAKDGRNFYRVEGRLDKVTDQLRPGMEGVGKITVDRRRLIWIWTHKAFDWLRLKAWQWMP